MPDPILVERIRQKLAESQFSFMIKQELENEGHSGEEIDEALDYIINPVPEDKLPDLQPLGHLGRLAGIHFRPFFVLKELKADVGMAKPLIFMLMMAGVAGLISLVFLLLTGHGLMASLIASGLGLLRGVIAVFAVSIIFHLLMKLFHAPNPYHQTFKAFAYMSSFWIVGTIIAQATIFARWLFYLNFILSVWLFMLLWYCLWHYTEISHGKLFAVWAIILGTAIAISLGLTQFKTVPNLLEYTDRISAPGPMPLLERRFDTPEYTVTTLEHEASWGNVDLYVEKAYFSDSFSRSMQELYGTSISDFKAQTKAMLPAVYAEVDRIEFTGKQVVDQDHVRLNYTVHYAPNVLGYTPSSMEDDAYLIKIGGEWLLDPEPEYKALGKI